MDSSQRNTVFAEKATIYNIVFYPFLKYGKQHSIKENVLVRF